jgi:CRISP-associated protein Cas1
VQALVPRIDPLLSPWSFAFRPGLGVRDALRAVASLRDEGATHLARLDISKCFDELEHSHVLDTLKTFLDDEWLNAMVSKMIRRGTSWRKAIHPRLEGIPQGAPLSPLLCNVALDVLDRRLLALGHRAVRYADDLAIPVKSVADGVSIVSLVREQLALLDLEISMKKTSITAIDNGVQFLGVEIRPTWPVAEVPIEPPDRKVIYVGVQGANVFLRKGHINVTKGDAPPLLSAPITQVGQIVLIGSVGLSAGLREHALRNAVEVSFLSRRGQWQGRLQGPSTGSVRLRAKQYALAENPEGGLELARAMIMSKLSSQRALLARYQSLNDELLTLLQDGLRSRVASAAACTSLASLRGIEGSGAGDFYRAMSRLLDGYAEFTTRIRRPATDPVNASLSYASALLTTEATAACALAGLDPLAGVFHQPGKNKPCMALDLMEEFRPLLVDRLVIELFRKRILNPEQFRADGTGAMLFTEAARRKFLDAWETQMLRETLHPGSDRKVTFRRAIELQARQVAVILTGSPKPYRGMVWR